MNKIIKIKLIVISFLLLIIIALLTTLYILQKNPNNPNTADKNLINIHNEHKNDSKQAYKLQKIGDEYYYISNLDGSKKTGFVTIDHKTYYFDKDGKMIKNQYIAYNKNDYTYISFFNSNGIMTTGTIPSDTINRTFDSNGNLIIDTNYLKNGINEIITKYGGDISIYYKDLRTNSNFAINNQTMYPCCMIKVPVLLKVFSLIDQGILQYDTYKFYIDNMIIISDNTSYNYLMEILGNNDPIAGAHSVNSYLNTLGIYDTHLHHGLRPGNGYFQDGISKNVGNAKDLGTLFEYIYDKNLFNETCHNQMIDILNLCDDVEYIKAGLPEDVLFPHKTGCAYDNYHDGGIIYIPYQDYILVIFSNGTLDQKGMMSEISAFIYNYQSQLVPNNILDLTKK